MKETIESIENYDYIDIFLKSIHKKVLEIVHTLLIFFRNRRKDERVF